MNTYELLEDEACKEGIDIIDYDFKSENIKGLYCDGTVGLSKSLETAIEKSCILAEELGHYYTTAGDILNQNDISNREQELRARLWAYDRLIGLPGIIKGHHHRCQNRYELAEFLEVTEEFLQEAIDCYTAKYGPYVIYGNYLIRFQPRIAVVERFEDSLGYK